MFHTQPYDRLAVGFYFEDQESLGKKIGSIRNNYGQPIEKYELQFIDGEAIDRAPSGAWRTCSLQLALLGDNGHKCISPDSGQGFWRFW